MSASYEAELTMRKENPDFWKILRQLKQDGAEEIAQHGYQYVYETHEHCPLGARYGFAPKSEFVGLSLARQRTKIVAGMEILKREGVPTDVWMAPAHSFDAYTLMALVALGFGAATDDLSPQYTDECIDRAQRTAQGRVEDR